MNGHLPECPSSSPDPLAADCCCARLHAVERRVGNLISASLVGGYDWRQGYLAGLDAAREAVDRLPAPYKVRGDFDTYGPYNEGLADMKDSALAVIEALREKP